MKIITTVNDETFEIELSVDPERENNFIAQIGDREIRLFVPERKSGSLTLSIDGRVGYYEFHKDRGKFNEAIHDNRSYRIDVKNPQQDQLEKLLEEFGATLGGGSDSIVLAPMPGKILGLSVKPGDKVEMGQMLLVLEAMKMENEISSTAEGVVKAVHVKVGDTVNADDVLVEFHPADG